MNVAQNCARFHGLSGTRVAFAWDMTSRILVTFGSKRSGTAELAERIADTLRSSGLNVECRRAASVGDLAPYDTVIIGGALYAARWVREARQFVRRNAGALRSRRVWMFSSGPLDDSAALREIPPTRQVSRLMAIVGARGHVTFGGRLVRDARGFPASAMAKTHAGDWRDWAQVRVWAEQIARAVAEPHTIVAKPPPRRTWLTALCALVATTAFGGGIALVAAPDGSVVHMKVQELEHSPFPSFLVPGLLLLGVIGLGNAIAAVLIARRARLANHVAACAGTALLVWTTTEIAMLRELHFLQPVYLGVAIVILVEAVRPPLSTGGRRTQRLRTTGGR